METTQYDPVLGVTYVYRDGMLVGHQDAQGNWYDTGTDQPAQTRQAGGGGDLGSMIGQAAAEFGVDPQVLANMVGIESGGDPNAYRGSDGYGGGPSVGLMQVKPDIWGGLAQQIGADPYDPMGNLRLGAAILAQGVAQYGSYDAALRNVYFPADDPNGTTQDEYVSRALGGASSFGGQSVGGGGSGQTGADRLKAMQEWQQSVTQRYAGQGGGGSQKTATATSGAAAGGWGARSAPDTRAPAQGGGFSGSPSGGSGGSSNRSLYWAWRNRLTGNLMPGGSSYGSSYGGSGYQPYKPQPWWKDDPPGRLSGFAKKSGYNEATLNQTIWSNPEWVLPDAVPGFNTNSEGGKELAAMPVGAMASLTTLGRSKNAKPGAYTNAVADLYQRAMGARGGLPGFFQSSQNLGAVRGKSALGQQFNPTSKSQPRGSTYPSWNTPSQAASAFRSTLGQLSDWYLDPMTAAAYQASADDLIRGWGNRAIRGNPRHAPNVNRYVMSRIFR